MTSSQLFFPPKNRLTKTTWKMQHLGCIKPIVNNGINYQPQLMQVSGRLFFCKNLCRCPSQDEVFLPPPFMAKKPKVSGQVIPPRRGSEVVPAILWGFDRICRKILEDVFFVEIINFQGDDFWGSKFYFLFISVWYFDIHLTSGMAVFLLNLDHFKAPVFLISEFLLIYKWILFFSWVEGRKIWFTISYLI